MGNTSGTPRKVTINGLSFDVAADANVTLNLSPYVTEGVTTSGRTMYKMTLRSPNAEGLPIIADPVEQDTLRQISEGLSSIPVSLTLADGSVFRTVGRINFESVETEENRATVIIIPDRARDAWQLFAAA